MAIATQSNSFIHFLVGFMVKYKPGIPCSTIQDVEKD